MGSSRVSYLQVVYSLGLSKPDHPLGVKPTRKDWGTCDAPFCAQPSSCPQVVGPQGDLWEDRGFPPALAIPQLWNKCHERGFHQTHSAHPCLPQNSHWAGPSQLVMWPYQWPGHCENNGLRGRAQNSSLIVGSGTKETDYLMKDSMSLIHWMWPLPAWHKYWLVRGHIPPGRVIRETPARTWLCRQEFLTHAHCQTMEPSLQTEERFWR